MSFPVLRILTLLETPKRLTPPWGITAKPVDETSISLQWQAEQDAVAYTIHRGRTQESLVPIRMGVKERRFLM